MDALRLAIGILTGLEALSPGEPLQVLIPTGIVIHICDAIVCRLVAARSRLDPNRWMILGLVFGIWAMIAILFVRRESSEPAST